MICLEISVNGEKVCTTGAADGILQATVDAVGPRWTGAEEITAKAEDSGLFHLIATGIVKDSGATELVRWIPCRRLAVGDEVSIRIVSSEHADVPVERVPYGKR